MRARRRDGETGGLHTSRLVSAGNPGSEYPYCDCICIGRFLFSLKTLTNMLTKSCNLARFSLAGCRQGQISVGRRAGCSSQRRRVHLQLRRLAHCTRLHPDGCALLLSCAFRQHWESLLRVRDQSPRMHACSAPTRAPVHHTCTSPPFSRSHIMFRTRSS